MPKQNLPPCPVCKTNKNVKAVGVIGDMFCCSRCGGGFDNEPDEGGDYHERNPAARMEREERQSRGRKFHRHS